MLGFLGGHDDPNAGNEHVELLQVLVTNFQKPEVMDKLVNAKTEDEYMEAVLSMEGL
jgi:PTS system galactitol-specific IIA component